MAGRIRALSLWQPWASLMAIGAKQLETRSWPAARAGLRPGELVAIHAAKRPMPYELRWEMHAPCKDVGLDLDHVPYGSVVSIHRFEECLPTTVYRDGVPWCAEWLDTLSEQELDFGDYGQDRYAWRMPLVYRLPQAPPVRGAQGAWWWDVPPDLAAELGALNAAR